MFVNFNFYFVILNPNTKVLLKINNHQKRKKRNDKQAFREPFENEKEKDYSYKR